jgi:hypothetical protein
VPRVRGPRRHLNVGVRAGELRPDYGAIVVPSQGRDGKSLVYDLEPKDRPAIVEVPVGEGRLLMNPTNPVYRWQNHGEFNMLFNALLNWDDLGGVKED